MEEAFFDTLLWRKFAWLEEFGSLPDESTMLRFCYRLTQHKLRLKAGAVVESEIFPALSRPSGKAPKR